MSVVAPALAGGPVQLAYGVADVEAAARRWAIHHGAGPFFVRRHIAVRDVLVDGEPGQFDHSSAYGWLGSLMVELVAVHDPPALSWSGLHHVAHFVDSFEQAGAELDALGWPPALVATAGGTRFAFHDARSDLGHLVEIYEPNDDLRRFYAMVSAAAEGWDGTDPVRVIG